MARSYTKDDEPVPGFRLVAFLGRGGFGEVWKATAPGGTEAAIKIINLSGKQGLKEFRAIRLVKKIRHPNLVPLYAFWLKDDQGNLLADSVADQTESRVPTPTGARRGPTAERSESAGMPRPAELIIAMGLGEKNLLDRMEECQRADQPGIPVDELLNYMEDAAKAIDFLNGTRHDMGSGPVAIQHCDIKPQNIMIVGGAAQVCDFGLARVLSGDIRTSLAAVSPAYGAPECLKSNQPSQSTDQYSLAISYVELRTGQLPFEGDSYPEVINAHLNGTLNLSRLTELERKVIRRATALEPADRYPTSMEMVRALRHAVEGRKTEPAGATTFDGMMAAGVELVPGYKLIHMLGRGGFGEVWEATAPGGKHVAVKIIRNLEGVKGKREFKALELIKGVDHNHLMELHAYWLLDQHGAVIPDELRDRPDGPTPSILVIAGKLANKNLLQRLDECRQQTGGGIPVPELLHYMRQSAEAIDYLNSPQHHLGDRVVSIQHRDIKPENILLAADIVKVGDFGLAKVVEGTASVIHADSRGLTLAYAAPEVLRGEVTRWTDQYSLAITYYQLRTGSLPFDPGTSPFELMELHRHGRLDFSRLPDAERAVIVRATAVVAESRFETCTELVHALETACGMTPSTSAVRIGPMPTAEPGRISSRASFSTPTGPYAPTEPSAEPQTTPAGDWRGTLLSPAATAEPVAPAKPYRETAPLAPVSTAGPEIETPARPREQVPEPRVYSRPRRFPLALLAACLVVAIGAGYLVWSIVSGPRTTPIVDQGGIDDAGKGTVGKPGTGNGDQDKPVEPPDLEPIVRRLVTSRKFTEAVEQADAVKEAGKRKPLIDLIRRTWSQTIDEAVQGNDWESAVEQCNGFLKHFASDSQADEIRARRQKAITSLLADAESNLEKDASEAHASFQRLSVLVGDGSPDLRIRINTGLARALARQTPPPLLEIRQVLKSDMGDRSDLPDGDLAHALAVEAIAIAPNPKTSNKDAIEDAMTILTGWSRQPKMAESLSPWERGRCAAIVQAALEQVKDLPPNEAQDRRQKLAALGFVAGAAMSAKIQQRIPQWSQPADFAAALKEIEQAIGDGGPDGWLLAAKAECLIEQRAGRPIKDESDLGQRAAYDPLVEMEAGSYGYYARALVQHIARQPEAAADELLKAFNTDWKLLTTQKLRRDRIVAILQEAASRMRGTLPDSDLGQSNPFQTPDRADKAYRWAKAANEFVVAVSEPLPVPLRVSLAQSAWYRTEPDSALAKQITRELSRDTSAETLGPAGPSILVIHARSHEKDNSAAGRAAAIDSYAKLLDLVTRPGFSTEVTPKQKFESILQPALRVSETASATDTPERETQRRMAQFYATTAQLLGQHRYEKWPFAEPAQTAVDYYDKAVKLDPDQPKYYAGRGFARSRPYAYSRMPQDVLTSVRQDADDAIRLDPDKQYPGGQYLRGYALLLESRTQNDNTLRAKNLLESVAAYTTAIELSKEEDEELPSLLTSSSAAHTELANFTIDPTHNEHKRLLLLAVQYAQRAIDRESSYKEYAWGALGNALEDLAWIVGETDNYEKAIAAFTKAIEARDEAKQRFDRGRCHFKRVVYGQQDSRYIDEALSDLEEATRRDTLFAEPFLWLGRAYGYRAQWEDADRNYSEAERISGAERDSYWLMYAIEWANAPFLEARARTVRNRNDPEIQKRLATARERAKKLEGTDSAEAAYITGQTYTFEGKVPESLAAYNAGLVGVSDKPTAAQAKVLAVRAVLVYEARDRLTKEVAKPLEQSIGDAELAARFLSDPSMKAYALATAAQSKISAALASGSTPEEKQRGADALHQLREAIQLAPQHALAWAWRELLAVRLKVYIDDSRVAIEDRRTYYREAIEHLEKAILAAPAKEKTRIGNFKEQIASKQP